MEDSQIEQEERDWAARIGQPKVQNMMLVKESMSLESGPNQAMGTARSDHVRMRENDQIYVVRQILQAANSSCDSNEEAELENLGQGIDYGKQRVYLVG